MARLSFLFVLCLLSAPIFAQRMAEFQLDDENALQIGEEELELLIDKKWYSRKFVYHEKETFNTYKGFLRDGMILYENYDLEIDGFKSTWSIHPENTILNISVPENSMTRLSGSFAIWEISDTSLTLTKVLTSKKDQVMVYYFTDKPPERYVLLKDAEYFERRERLKKEVKHQKML